MSVVVIVTRYVKALIFKLLMQVLVFFGLLRDSVDEMIWRVYRCPGSLRQSGSGSHLLSSD